MRELISRNDLKAEQMVSCISTSTHDLNAEFPAVRARKSGSTWCRSSAPGRSTLPNAKRSVIRVLLHYYAPPGPTPAHAYLARPGPFAPTLKGGAVALESAGDPEDTEAIFR